MSSPSHCRPAVPPKPALGGVISPTTLNAVTAPGLTRQTDERRQTVGTQVNMLRKPPPLVSSSASGPRSTNHDDNSPENKQQQDESERVRPAKPALPPKPTSSTVKKGPTSSSPKTNLLISNTTSPSSDSSTQHQQQKLWGPNFRNVHLKPVKIEGAAPVAYIDELENLSDLSSPSPVKSTLTPTSANQIRPPVFSKPFQNQKGTQQRQHDIPHGLPKSPNHHSSSSTAFNSLPISPRDFGKSPSSTGGSSLGGHVFNFPNSSSSTTNTSHIFSSQQIEERRGKAASLGRNINFSNVNSSSVFGAPRFQRNHQSNLSPNNSISNANVKKSLTLSSRISPLDLSTSTSSSFVSNSNIHSKNAFKSPNTAPVLSGHRNPNSPPPSSILQFGRPISFSPDHGTPGTKLVTPPPPPPRLKRKLSNQLQNQQELSPEIQNNPNSNNNTSSPPNPNTSPKANTGNKPYYATVDKEKKWAERLQKQHQQQQGEDTNTTPINEPRIEDDSNSTVNNTITAHTATTLVHKLTVTNTNVECGNNIGEEDNESSVVNSSLTITSWLGKFIQSEQERQSESTTDEPEKEATNFMIHQSTANNHNNNSKNNSTTSLHSNHNIVSEQQNNNNNDDGDDSTSNNINENSQNVSAQKEQLTHTNHDRSAPNLVECSNSLIKINVANNKISSEEFKGNSDIQNQNKAMDQEHAKEEQDDVNSNSFKDNLCRNESFLYAMQEPIDTRETDNIASKEINLSISSTVTLDEHNDDEQILHANSSLPISNIIIDSANNASIGAPHPSHIEQSQINKNSNNNNNNNMNFTEIDSTSHQEQLQLETPGNRESALDIFEKELEHKLESSFGSFQLSRVDTFNTHKPSDKYKLKNNNNDDNNSPSPSLANSHDDSQQVNNNTKEDDPSRFLEFVDSRLQSMQDLLANIGGSTPASTEPSNTSNNNATHHGNLVHNNKIDPLITSPARNISNSKSRGVSFDAQTEHEVSKTPDSDIIKDILFNSGRFGDNNSSKEKTSSVPSRRATEPEVTTTTTQNDPENENRTGEGQDNQSQLSSLDSQHHHHHNNFNRRSWTLSDYSPSDSSSSSGSLKKNHHRKHVSSMVDFIDDDELSTGNLGDAESDAPGASAEDVGGSGGGKVVTKRKHGIVRSLFGSFGKSGGHNSVVGSTDARQSQFFLDSSDHNQQDDNNDSQTNVGGSREDKSRSLPPSSTTTEPPPRPHRSLQRTSVSFVPSPSSNLVESNNTVDSPEAMSKSPLKTGTTTDGMMANYECSDGVEGKRESAAESHSTRSSIGYDEILADLPVKHRKAFFVAREILTSERTFVDVLNLLTIDFPHALKLASDAIRMPVISPPDLDFILGGLPTLKGVNEVLVSELEKRILGWKENPKVADIIVRTGPFLKHYSTYVRDFERIVQRLDNCCGKTPAFARAVRDFEGSERCQKLGLKHYMLKPIQRMPQYRLLLEDYLKTLDEESEDYSDTIKAIAIVREVAEHANEAINLQINAEKLMNLQNRLPNIILLRANRFLLKEGELLKVCRKELQPRYFALMTDVLLCMTYNASSSSTNMKDLKLRYNLPLAGMRIALPASEDYLNEFSVICTTRSFNVVAKSCRERDEWMKALSSAIDDNIKKRACTSTENPSVEFRLGHEAPLWIPDKRVTMCQVCTGEFTVTYRRHHCRACGRVVCGNCSGNQAPLAYQKHEVGRVCESCYQYLLEEFDRENCENNTPNVNEIRSRFKKVVFNPTTKVQRRSIPDKFKIGAMNAESQMSGYLQWRKGKTWKRNWFVLMERVLYVYAASEDVVATRTIPVLGYQVENVTPETANPGTDPDLMFKLTHTGQNPITFMAENYSSAQKWMTAIQEATVLT